YMCPSPPITPLFPYTTLFRSRRIDTPRVMVVGAFLDPETRMWCAVHVTLLRLECDAIGPGTVPPTRAHSGYKTRTPRVHARGRRSEEHTSELQSRENLVCRLL